MGAHHAVAALAHASDDEVVVEREVQLRRSAEVALGLALGSGLGLGLPEVALHLDAAVHREGAHLVRGVITA